MIAFKKIGVALLKFLPFPAAQAKRMHIALEIYGGHISRTEEVFIVGQPSEYADTINAWCVILVQNLAYRNYVNKVLALDLFISHTGQLKIIFSLFLCFFFPLKIFLVGFFPLKNTIKSHQYATFIIYLPPLSSDYKACCNINDMIRYDSIWFIHTSYQGSDKLQWIIYRNVEYLKQHPPNKLAKAYWCEATVFLPHQFLCKTIHHLIIIQSSYQIASC